MKTKIVLIALLFGLTVKTEAAQQQPQQNRMVAGAIVLAAVALQVRPVQQQNVQAPKKYARQETSKEYVKGHQKKPKPLKRKLCLKAN